MNLVKLDRLLRNRELSWLALFAIVIIPLGTYLFATNESPYRYTMSMMGNRMGYRLNFIIWGIVTGIMLGFFIIRLFVLKSFKDPRSRKLLVWSLVFLLLTVLIPSVESLPLLSKLHTLSAALFGLSLIASLYLFTKHLEDKSPRVYTWGMVMIHIIIGGPLVLLFLFGMNAIFQLFFFFSISIFLAILKLKLTRKNKTVQT